MECSGIVLDEENEFQVISWPHKKFFNYNEMEMVVDKKPFASGTRVYEKLNGLSCTLYQYKGSWQISSSNFSQLCNP